MEGSYVIRTFFVRIRPEIFQHFFALSAQFSAVEVNQFSTSNTFFIFLTLLSNRS
jgi:hypothetical protein